MFKQISLRDLQLGESGIVSHLTAEGNLRRRLLDLGFVPGTTVKNERISPLGDPIAFSVHGALIALREDESRLVKINKKGGATHGVNLPVSRTKCMAEEVSPKQK